MWVMQAHGLPSVQIRLGIVLVTLNAWNFGLQVYVKASQPFCYTQQSMAAAVACQCLATFDAAVRALGVWYAVAFQ